MTRGLKPKDMVIDFLNTAFLIILIALCIFFFIVEDYFFVAAQMGKAVFASALMGIVFLLKFKVEKNKINHLKQYEALGEVAVYFTNIDIYKNLFLSIAAVLSIIVFALINGKIDSLSILYVMIISVIVGFWHFILFHRKDDNIQMYYATNGQVINDKLIMFLLPVIMMVLTVFKEGVNLLRILQILGVFSVLYLRHWLIFKKNK